MPSFQGKRQNKTNKQTHKARKLLLASAANPSAKNKFGTATVGPEPERGPERESLFPSRARLHRWPR